MHKPQHINTKKYIKKQDNMTPPKVRNSSITKSKDIEIVEMLDKEFKSLV
jgi:hypothetical protein